MPIKSPNDLFVYDLSTAYYSEHAILKGMEEWVRVAHSDRVKQMLNNHIKESHKQVSILEQCFSQLGVQPKQVKCHVADGLLEDFKAVSKDIQDARLIDMAILGAADKTEHFETATYRTLISQAKLMGQTNVAKLLSQIEAGEEKEANMVETAEQEIGRQIIGAVPTKPTARPRVGL